MRVKEIAPEAAQDRGGQAQVSGDSTLTKKQKNLYRSTKMCK